MMKKYNIIIAFAAMTAMTSCADSFFDLKPNNEVTVDKVYTTAENFNMAVMGCYAKMQTQVNFYMELCEYRSDNLDLNAPTTGTQDRYDICQFSEKASNGILETYWANFDNNVYRCNLVLDAIDNATFDEDVKNQYKAEAMFIRAYTYFNMYRIWGGVPVARTVVTASEALSVKRCTDAEMYNYIAGDLEKIIENAWLPETYSSTNNGRVTLGAAKALLGKVYLTFGENQKAATILSTLIGKYSLLADPLKVFSVDNKTNNEVIFAINFDKTIVDEGHGYWYSITNLSDDTNQTEILQNAYSDSDLRKSLIQYVKLSGVNVCLMNKFYDMKDAVTQTVGNNQILIRYADVLLMYAEALNNISFDNSMSSPAMIALNEVHNRAGLSTYMPQDLENQASFKKAILDERQKEFPYEGQRWFDLVRMGYAKEAMAKLGFNISDSQLLYPIPTSELERINNTEILWQNPGY